MSSNTSREAERITEPFEKGHKEMKKTDNNYTCNEYREEMLLLGLNRRLAQKHLPAAEKEKIRQEIARLEAAMEMD